MNVFSVRLAQTGGHLTIQRPDALQTSAFSKWIATRWVVSPLLLGLLPGIALAAGPVITSVSSISPTPTQTITITGTGFGTLSPFNGDSPYIRISDVTREWNAGSTRDPGSDLVTLDVTSWTDTQITVAGFTGDYGAPPYSVPYNWTLNDGDTVDVQIWNAQTGAGPAQFNAVVGAPATTFTTSVTPDSGSGASQVFAFQYLDTNGYTHLSLAYAGFGPTAYGDENTCRLEYVRASNQLYLKNDAGTAFLGPVTPGGVGTLSNNQCSVNVGASSVTGSGDILTLSLPLSFTPAFAGTQGIFMYADDRNGQTTAGRQQRGTWVVP